MLKAQIYKGKFCTQNFSISFFYIAEVKMFILLHYFCVYMKGGEVHWIQARIQDDKYSLWHVRFDSTGYD